MTKWLRVKTKSYCKFWKKYSNKKRRWINTWDLKCSLWKYKRSKWIVYYCTMPESELSRGEYKIYEWVKDEWSNLYKLCNSLLISRSHFRNPYLYIFCLIEFWFFCSEYRDNKDEEKIKTIKKKQRGILLKVTKSILDLDKWVFIFHISTYFRLRV